MASYEMKIPWECTVIHGNVILASSLPLCRRFGTAYPALYDRLLHRLCSQPSICVFRNTDAFPTSFLTDDDDSGSDSSQPAIISSLNDPTYLIESKDICESRNGSWVSNTSHLLADERCNCIEPQRSPLYQSLVQLNNSLGMQDKLAETPIGCWFPPCGATDALVTSEVTEGRNNCPQDRFLCATGNIDVNNPGNGLPPLTASEITNISQVCGITRTLAVPNDNGDLVELLSLSEGGEVSNVSSSSGKTSEVFDFLEDTSRLVSEDMLGKRSWYRFLWGVSVCVGLAALIIFLLVIAELISSALGMATPLVQRAGQAAASSLSQMKQKTGGTRGGKGRDLTSPVQTDEGIDMS